MDPPVEEGAGSQHHRPAAKAHPGLRDGADDPLARSVRLEHQVVHRLLEQPQISNTYSSR